MKPQIAQSVAISPEADAGLLHRRPTGLSGLSIIRLVVLGLSMLAGALQAAAGGSPSATLLSLEMGHRWQSWSVSQGLPSSAVTSIIQTHDGYLWFGTQEGLARFDGMHFTVLDEKTSPCAGAGADKCIVRGAGWHAVDWY